MNTLKIAKMLNVFDTRIKKGEDFKAKWTQLSTSDIDIIPMCLALHLASLECLEDLHNKGYTDDPVVCKPKEPLLFASSLILELHKERESTL